MVKFILNSNSRATLEDWSEVSNQLIYETMEISFQASLIQSEATKLKDLIASMILFQYGLTNDPLEKALGFSLGSPVLINGSIIGFVCHPGTKRMSNPPIGILHTEQLHLLPRTSNIARYRSFKTRFAFLSNRPPRIFGTYGFYRSMHSNGNVTDFSSIIDYLPLHLSAKMLDKIIYILTVCNTFMILFMLRRQ